MRKTTYTDSKGKKLKADKTTVTMVFKFGRSKFVEEVISAVEEVVIPYGASVWSTDVAVKLKRED